MHYPDISSPQIQTSLFVAVLRAHRVAGKRYGFECKYSDAPGTTRAMRVAISDLQLSHLWVVYPGNEAYELDDQISVLPIRKTPSQLDRLLG